MNFLLSPPQLARAAVLFSVLVLAQLLTAAVGNGVTVRGRLERADASGRHPAPYIQVTLNQPNRGRSAPAYTDLQGMYYFYNVPHGSYQLEIWLSKDPKQKPIVYKIDVQKEPYSDIAAIVIH